MSLFTDTVSAAIRKIGTSIGSPLRTLASWPAQIIARRSNGTLDGATDDESVAGPGGFGGTSAVVGLPGCHIEPQAGQRVRVGFRGGDVGGLEVTAFEDTPEAERGIARRGDRVLIGTLLLGAAPPPMVGSVLTFSPAVSPYSGELVLPITIAATGLIVTGLTPGFPTKVYGWIDTGSPEVMLRKLETESIP